MNPYKQLLKIKKPVLIEVKISKKSTTEYIRYRILYPNGHCEWTNTNRLYVKSNPWVSDQSCFVYDEENMNLKNTVSAMKSYDKEVSLKIVRFYGI